MYALAPTFLIPMCIYIVFIMQTGKKSPHWIARIIGASIYSNLLILFKMASDLSKHFPSLIFFIFVFKMLGVPKAFVTSSLQLL